MEAQLTVEEIANLFRAADEDGSGFLSPLEIASIMTQLNGGVSPSEEEVASCLRAMDSNEDGQISEEEFLDAMLTWLKMVKAPGKRQLDAAESPAFSRKKTLNDMANFFRQFSTIPNFAAEQNRILTSRRKEIDMAAVHREYAMLTADEKAEVFENIKLILADGKIEIMKEIHSLDWNVVLIGVGKVNTLLSVVEMFQSQDERLAFASTIFPIFEGLSEESPNDGSIIRRLCNLLTPEVPFAIQSSVFVPCLHALRNYIVGPRISCVESLSEGNIWNPDAAFTKQVVEREQLPLRLMKILDDYSVVTATNQELLTAAVKCISAFSEENLGCLECMLNIGFRQRVIDLLKQGATGLDLCRSSFGCLAVLCGYSHTFDPEVVDSVPSAVGITEQELFDILVVIQSTCNKIVDTGMLDEVVVMNVALVCRYLLPLCNPQDPLYKSIIGPILRLMQHPWASEGAGLYTSIALDYCIVEVMSTSREICLDMWQTTSVSDVMLQQIQSISTQSMADISSEICVTCLCFFEQLLEYNLLEVLAHHKNHGFIKHCVTLLPSSECGNHVMTFLAKCTKYPDLLPTLVSLGVIDGFFGVFSKFKQTVNTLSEVLGAFVGPVYSVTVIKTLAQHLLELLTDNVESNAKIFNGDHIDIIVRLHGVVCEELRKGQLKFSQELIDMCDALLELLEAIAAAHVSTQSRLAAMMTHECSQISAKWNKDLNAAFTTGSLTANTDMETELEDANAPAPMYSSHVAQRTDIEIIGVPQWNGSNGGKVLRATVPRNVTIDMLRNGFSSMCQRAISLHFQNDSRVMVPLTHQNDLQVLIERASNIRTLRPAVTLHLKMDNSTNFSSNSFRSQPNPITTGKKKESVLAELKRHGVQIGKKVNSELMSAFYDYFRDQNVVEINQEQFVRALTSDKLGYEEQFAADIFNGFDDDGNGTLSLTEIAIGFAKLMNGSTDDKLALMFQAYDTDRNNALDVDELTNMIMVSAGLSYEDAHQHAHTVGTTVDENGDGWLDFDEFKKAAYTGLIPLGISWTADHIVAHHSKPPTTHFKPPTDSTRIPARPSAVQRSRTFDEYQAPPPPSIPALSRTGGGQNESTPALVRGGGTGPAHDDVDVPQLSRTAHSADDVTYGRKRGSDEDDSYQGNAGRSNVKAAVRQSVTDKKVNPFGNKKK